MMSYRSPRREAGQPFDKGEVVIEGFLKKSSLLQKPAKPSILCVRGQPVQHTKWKKRYFVLYKVRYPRETEVLFEYFKDQNCKKFEGCVDLKSCTRVYADNYLSENEFVFVMVTQLRGRAHTYNFATVTHEERKNWVDKLVRVMNMVVETPNESILPNIRSWDSSRQRIGSPSALGFNTISCKDNQPWSGNINNTFSQNMDNPAMPNTDSTDEYRMTVDDSYAENCFPLFPSMNHAYINLPGDTQSLEPKKNRNDVDVSILCENTKQCIPSQGNDIYFNVWGNECTENTEGNMNNGNTVAVASMPPPRTVPHSRGVDDNVQLSPSVARPMSNCSENEYDVMPTINHSHNQRHGETDQSPSVTFKESDSIGLPVRTAPRCTGENSASSSDAEDEDEVEEAENPILIENERNDSDGLNELLPQSTSIISSSQKCLLAPTSVCPQSAVEKTTRGAFLDCSIPANIQYLEAECLDFSEKPIVPQKFTRVSCLQNFKFASPERSVPLEEDQNNLNKTEYKELDTASTSAIAFWTKRLLEDDNQATANPVL